MLRYIEKRAFLPIKWWIRYQRKKQSTHLQSTESILEKKTEVEEQLHEAKRKNNKVLQDELRGFIQAIDWVCHQEQSEYKQ